MVSEVDEEKRNLKAISVVFLFGFFVCSFLYLILSIIQLPIIQQNVPDVLLHDLLAVSIIITITASLVFAVLYLLSKRQRDEINGTE